jgi:hypothetical protein
MRGADLIATSVVCRLIGASRTARGIASRLAAIGHGLRRLDQQQLNGSVARFLSDLRADWRALCAWRPALDLTCTPQEWFYSGVGLILCGLCGACLWHQPSTQHAFRSSSGFLCLDQTQVCDDAHAVAPGPIRW